MPPARAQEPAGPPSSSPLPGEIDGAYASVEAPDAWHVLALVCFAASLAGKPIARAIAPLFPPTRYLWATLPFGVTLTLSMLGTLLALSGAEVLHALALPGEVTIVGIILLTATVNLVVGSASAKWALISPILVPMLMAVGISPELTQAAYRVGDSASNIITPLMVFFPLVVVYCQQYVKSTGIGTLVSMMLPYSLAFLVSWTGFLLIYWALGFPLGLQAPYVYPAP